MNKVSIVSLRLWTKSYIVSIDCKAAKQYFLVVLPGFMIFPKQIDEVVLNLDLLAGKVATWTTKI